MNRKFALFLATSIVVILLLASGCTKIQTMNLEASYKDIAGAAEEGIEGQTEEAANDAGNYAGEANDNRSLSGNETEEQREEMPMAIQQDANIYVNPDALVKKSCTEKVLLGLRRCKNAGEGDLNITIKNAGFLNVTMIFYLQVDTSEIGYYYSGEPLNAKDEKTYTLDLDKLQETYGPINKIQATPVLVQGLEADACINKKLPIIVSGCG